MTLFDFYGARISPLYFKEIHGSIDGEKFTVTRNDALIIRNRRAGISRRVVELITIPGDYYIGHIFYRHSGKFKKQPGRKYFDCKNRNVSGWNPDND